MLWSKKNRTCTLLVSSYSRYWFWRARLIWLTAARGVKWGPGVCPRVWQSRSGFEHWCIFDMAQIHAVGSSTTGQALWINGTRLINKRQATFSPLQSWALERNAASWKFSKWGRLGCALWNCRLTIFFFLPFKSAVSQGNTQYLVIGCRLSHLCNFYTFFSSSNGGFYWDVVHITAPKSSKVRGEWPSWFELIGTQITTRYICSTGSSAASQNLLNLEANLLQQQKTTSSPVSQEQEIWGYSGHQTWTKTLPDESDEPRFL